MLSFFERYDITLESYLPYSPDLNLIEHTWVLLKRQVHIDYPWIGEYPGGPQKVKKKLGEILPRYWEKIPPKQFEALWRPMPDRVQAVIKSNWCYTLLFLLYISYVLLLSFVYM